VKQPAAQRDLARSPVATSQSGDDSLSRKRLDEPERLYRETLAGEPLNFGALRGLGRLLMQQGRSEDARHLLNVATTVAPNHAGVWCELGIAHALLGRLQNALDCYDRALSLRANYAEACANKGAALASLKRPVEALVCFDQALALDSRLATVHSGRGGVLRELGRSAEALESLDRALALSPGNVDALNNRGAALVDIGRAEEGLSAYDQALAASPDNANIYNNRGNALLALNRPGEALASYDRAASIAPPSAEMLNNRGIALRALKRYGEALDCFGKAIALAPLSASTYDCLAGTFLELQRPAEALTLYDLAIRLDPRHAGAFANRASALVALNRDVDAIASCEAALAIAPSHFDALVNRGASLTRLGRENEALLDYEAAIARAGRSALAHENKGVALLQLGRLAEAAGAFQTAIALEPSRPRAYYHLSLAQRLGEGHVQALEALVQEGAPTEAIDRIYGHFALGKACGDLADAAGSSHHYAAGNALKRRLDGYDEAKVIGLLERSRLAYADDLMRRFAGAGAPSSDAIFVLGMPRSGTTLVEQILASHPFVFGAGEINDFEIAALEIGGDMAAALNAPERLSGLRPEDFARLGEAYLARLRARSGSAMRIINKMTENFRCAGLIALALPRARIIHVRRDPLDTCFSCFTNLFVESHPYAYELGELGRYYRAYEALMAHWRRALPSGMMLEVRYEDIVANLEGEGRRIVAHCGLDWDPRCLDFHRTERAVRTASLAQVRRPIYASSVGRWRRYEAFLAPLVEALGPCVGSAA
jgi:tetratricopeptide (TPR) repeat protein